MLGSLRKNAQSWIIKTVLWIIVAAFIGTIFLVWGRGGDVAESDVAATVNERIITINQFYDEYQNLDRIYRQVYGELLDKNLIDKNNLKKEAISNLISRALMLDAADKLQVRVSDDEIQSDIAGNPVFSSNGSFSKEKYLQLLRTNSISPKEYEEQKKVELKLKKLTDFIQSTVRVSEKEVRDRFVVLKREIKVNYLAFDPEKIAAKAPGKDEIAAYYGENRDDFRTPALARVEYGAFKGAAFLDRAEVSKEELKTYYDANQDRYPAPEMRRLYEIAIPYKGKEGKNSAFEKGRIIKENLSTGKTSFREEMKVNTAKAADKEVMRGTWYGNNDLPGDISKVVFSLPVDGVTSPIDTGKAVKLFKIAEIKRADTLPLGEVREKVELDLKMEKSKDLAIIKAYEARGRIVKGEDFGAVIESYGIKTEKSGLAAVGSEAPPLDNLIASSFILSSGETGEVKEVGGSYFVYRLIEKRSPTVMALEDVSKKISRRIREEKKKEEAMNIARRTIIKSNEAGSLKKGGENSGGKYGTSPYFSPLTSTGISGIEYSGVISKALLSIGKSSRLAKDPVEAGGKIYLIEFAGEKKVSMKDYENERGQIASILFEQKKQMALQSFINEQREKATIKMGEELKI